MGRFLDHLTVIINISISCCSHLCFWWDTEWGNFHMARSSVFLWNGNFSIPSLIDNFSHMILLAGSLGICPSIYSPQLGMWNGKRWQERERWLQERVFPNSASRSSGSSSRWPETRCRRQWGWSGCWSKACSACARRASGTGWTPRPTPNLYTKSKGGLTRAGVCDTF